MIPYIFATVSYAAGIFLDTTNNYQLTKSSTLKTNCFFVPKTRYQVSITSQMYFIIFKKPVTNAK